MSNCTSALSGDMPTRPKAGSTLLSAEDINALATAALHSWRLLASQAGHHWDWHNLKQAKGMGTPCCNMRCASRNMQV